MVLVPTTTNGEAYEQQVFISPNPGGWKAKVKCLVRNRFLVHSWHLLAVSSQVAGERETCGMSSVRVLSHRGGSAS